MKNPIKLGERFYDERNGRYITPDGVGCDPKCYFCIVEEITEEGDLVVVERALFMAFELEKMKRR